MKDLVYRNVISKGGIATFDNILRDKRLLNHLWIELILNSEMVSICELHIEESIINDALIKALSWYLGFKWFLPENRVIEKLYERRIINPYQLRDEVYRQDRRDFLKGILHARVC